MTWSGGCSNGLAQGNGRVSWFQNDELSQIVEGRLQDGRRHGTWTEYDESGNELGTIRYENGRRVGDLDGSVALDPSSDGRPLAGHGHEAASAPHDGGPP